MLPTPRTVLAIFHPLGMKTLVLGLVVVPLLAFRTTESDLFSRHVYLSLRGLVGPAESTACIVFLGPGSGVPTETSTYSSISVTTPDPTVRPPSRIANRSCSSIAIGVINSTSICTLSPGITISTPSGSCAAPVTSVVRK